MQVAILNSPVAAHKTRTLSCILEDAENLNWRQITASDLEEIIASMWLTEVDRSFTHERRSLRRPVRQELSNPPRARPAPVLVWRRPAHASFGTRPRMSS